MSAKKMITADIRLDQYGRAVLDGDLLDAIMQHDPGVPLAGGTNSSNCSNNGCMNYGCGDPSQANHQCTNVGCGGNMNYRCTNNVDGG